jgi:hypothetical protein
MQTDNIKAHLHGSGIETLAGLDNSADSRSHLHGVRGLKQDQRRFCCGVLVAPSRVRGLKRFSYY